MIGWGLNRTGNQIRDRLSRAMPSELRAIRDGDTFFYWPEGMDPATWEGFRVAGGSPDSKRPLEEISLEEIGNLAVFLLAAEGGMAVEALARSVCRTLGIGRMSGDAQTRVRQALTGGRVSALVEVDGEMVVPVRP